MSKAFCVEVQFPATKLTMSQKPALINIDPMEFGADYVLRGKRLVPNGTHI